MVQQKLPLKQRHAIKQAMAEITQDSRIIRTKAGKRVAEGLQRIRTSFRTMHGLGGQDIDKAIETKNWKMAIWLAIENNPESNASKEVGSILFELYKRECDGKTRDARDEQWVIYMREIFNGVFDFYAEKDEIPDDVAGLMVKASDLARRKIEKFESERDKPFNS